MILASLFQIMSFVVVAWSAGTVASPQNDFDGRIALLHWPVGGSLLSGQIWSSYLLLLLGRLGGRFHVLSGSCPGERDISICRKGFDQPLDEPACRPQAWLHDRKGCCFFTIRSISGGSSVRSVISELRMRSFKSMKYTQSGKSFVITWSSACEVLRSACLSVCLGAYLKNQI